MRIKPLRSDLKLCIKNRGLIRKWIKAGKLFEQNVRHPSLNVELMEPKWRGIYSFRLDKKYRALFFISENEAEVFQTTKHYRKS